MRRIVVAAGALALVAGASFTASADAPTRTAPRAGCNLYTDPLDDASTAGAVGVNSPMAPVPSVTVLQASQTNAKGLDITGVSYRLSDAVFSTIIKVPGLAFPGVERGAGDTWRASFTINKKPVVISGTRVTSVAQANSAYRTVLLIETASISGTIDRKVPVSGEYDVLRGVVTLSASRGPLEQAVGASLDAELSAVSVTSAANVVTGTYTHDTAAPPKTLVVNPADNHCFV